MDIAANPLQKISVDKNLFLGEQGIPVKHYLHQILFFSDSIINYSELMHSFDSVLIEEKVASLKPSKFMALVQRYYNASIEVRSFSSNVSLLCLNFLEK